MNKLIKKEIARVKTFHRTFLLLMVFANVMIEANFKSQSVPKKRVLNLEHPGSHATVPDRDITISNGEISAKL